MEEKILFVFETAEAVILPPMNDVVNEAKVYYYQHRIESQSSQSRTCVVLAKKKRLVGLELHC